MQYRDVRHYFLYICGKIGLTLYFLLVSFFDAVNEVGKLEQIRHAKGGSTGGQGHVGVRRNQARPARRQRPHALRRLIKRDAVLSPIVAARQDFKLLAVQGMKRMGDRENSFRKRG